MGVGWGASPGLQYCSLRMRRNFIHYTALLWYAAKRFLHTVRFTMRYEAALQYGFHLFFEYAAETIVVVWHVIPTDDNMLCGW